MEKSELEYFCRSQRGPLSLIVTRTGFGSFLSRTVCPFSFGSVTDAGSSTGISLKVWESYVLGCFSRNARQMIPVSRSAKTFRVKSLRMIPGVLCQYFFQSTAILFLRFVRIKFVVFEYGRLFNQCFCEEIVELFAAQPAFDFAALCHADGSGLFGNDYGDCVGLF